MRINWKKVNDKEYEASIGPISLTLILAKGSYRLYIDNYLRDAQFMYLSDAPTFKEGSEWAKHKLHEWANKVTTQWETYKFAMQILKDMKDV